MIAREVVVKRAPRREHARQRSSVETACVQLRHETPQMMDLQLGERRGGRVRAAR
jgi:hypothetical protein